MDKNQLLERTKMFQRVFEKHGSDKATHGYAAFYAEHLPENPKSILEIGVKEGASIRAWRELFPFARITGFDLFEEFDFPKIEGVNFCKGDQRNASLLSDVVSEFMCDVIIDDGSHNARDQMISFMAIASAGMDYFIEDTHCNDEEFYAQGLPIIYRAGYIFDYNIKSKSHFFDNGKSKMIHIKL